MALDNTAADALVPLVRMLYASIVANAVVLPSGTPQMTAGGDDVAGNGRIT